MTLPVNLTVLILLILLILVLHSRSEWRRQYLEQKADYEKLRQRLAYEGKALRHDTNPLSHQDPK